MASGNRIQFRNGNTLAVGEQPLPGEPFWDDVNRMIGFYNGTTEKIDWFRIPETSKGDPQPTLPGHRWVGTVLQFQDPDGQWGVGVDLGFEKDGEIPTSSDDLDEGTTKLLMTPQERQKLFGVATQATRNSSDAELRDRSTHTGTQSADTITDGVNKVAMLPAERTKLSNIAAEATKNALDAALRDRGTHTGTQSADTITDGTTKKVMTANERTKLADLPTASALATTISQQIPASQKGVANGVATLDAQGFVPASQLPSYVDDVLEYATLAAFPATGEEGKIYVAKQNNKVYRWSGSTYIEIVSSPGSSDAVTEGTTNKYFTESRVRSTLLTGVVFTDKNPIATTDTFLVALGKVQAQLNAVIPDRLASTLTEISNVDLFTQQGWSYAKPATPNNPFANTHTILEYRGDASNGWQTAREVFGTRTSRRQRLNDGWQAWKSTLETIEDLDLRYLRAGARELTIPGSYAALIQNATEGYNQQLFRINGRNAWGLNVGKDYFAMDVWNAEAATDTWIKAVQTFNRNTTTQKVTWNTSVDHYHTGIYQNTGELSIVNGALTIVNTDLRLALKDIGSVIHDMYLTTRPNGAGSDEDALIVRNVRTKSWIDNPNWDGIRRELGRWVNGTHIASITFGDSAVEGENFGMMFRTGGAGDLSAFIRGNGVWQFQKRPTLLGQPLALLSEVQAGSGNMRVYNVLDYGAVADCTGQGAGTDVTPAILAAFNAAKAQYPSGGFVIHVPQGRFRAATAAILDGFSDNNLAQNVTLDFVGNITTDKVAMAWLTLRKLRYLKIKAYLYEGGVFDGWGASGGGPYKVNYGTTADVISGGGQEAFRLESVNACEVHIRAYGYAGRILRTTSSKTSWSQATEFDPMQGNITGRIESRRNQNFGKARCAQSIWADAALIGLGDWGSLDYLDEGFNGWGPVFVGVNDVLIDKISGAYTNLGPVFRGCAVIKGNHWYIGDIDGNPGNWHVTFTTHPSDANIRTREVKVKHMHFLQAGGGMLAERVQQIDTQISYEGGLAFGCAAWLTNCQYGTIKTNVYGNGAQAINVNGSETNFLDLFVQSNGSLTDHCIGFDAAIPASAQINLELDVANVANGKFGAYIATAATVIIPKARGQGASGSALIGALPSGNSTRLLQSTVKGGMVAVSGTAPATNINAF